MIKGKAEGEAASLVGGRFDLDIAVVEVGEFLGEGEAEARTGLGGVEGGVELTEGLKEGVEVGGGDADAGVAHGEAEVRGADGDAEGDGALGGELDRVGEEVHEDLLEAAGVGDVGGKMGVEVEVQIEVGDPGEFLDDRDRALAEISNPHGFKIQFFAVGLNFGQIEEVINQGEEVVAGFHDRSEILVLFGIEGAVDLFKEGLGKAQNAR